VSKVDPKLLRVDIPRLVHGGGSMVRMGLTTDTKQSASNQSVIVHAIYDQGSQTNEKVIPLWIFLFGNPLVSVLVGLVTLVVTLLIYRNFRQRKSQSILKRLNNTLDYIIEDKGVSSTHGRRDKLLDLTKLQTFATDLFFKKRLSESHFNVFKEQFHRRVFEIFYVVLAGKEISIFGYGFGEEAGVIIIDGQKSEIKQWSNTRIDAKHYNIVSEESTLTVIKNTGVMKVGQFKDFTFKEKQDWL
jgi:hypothetical protein